MVAVLVPDPPIPEVLDTFLSRHQHLLQLERQEEEEQTRLLNSNCSPKVLEQRGLALGGLGVSSISVGLGGKSLVELTRPLAYHTTTDLPPHTFRNGDPVRIEAHVGPSTKGKGKKKATVDDEEGAVEGVVYKISTEKVVVAVEESKEINLPERLRLLKLANSVTFDRMDRTISHLKRILLPESSEGSTIHPHNLPLINSLVGVQPPTWTKSPPRTLEAQSSDAAEGAKTDDVEWFDKGLNDSQKEAIRFCLTAEHVACIHGPPGTGKTHTLIELIFQLLSRPSSSSSTLPPKILIATPSNLALDNLLLRLHHLSLSPPYSTLLPRDSILRLGHPTRVHKDLVRETLDWKAANGDDGGLLRDVGKELDAHLSDLAKRRGERGAVKGKERGQKWDEVRELRKERRQREVKVVKNVVDSAQVILATCHSAGSRQLNNMQFDICIVDEATQAVEAVCWVPILKSKRLILAGDPQQLPPTIMSKPDKVKSSDGGANVNLENGVKDLGIKSKPALRPPRSLETTLFDRLEKLYGSGIKRVLQVQYRMNENVAAFPSKTLYDSALISSPSVATRTLLQLPSIIDAASEDAIDTLESPIVFFDTAGCEYYERAEEEGQKGAMGEGSKSNENEAIVVCAWAKKLEIAVVTPYQAQVSLISSLLHKDYPTMTIGSVDGLQGQEREAIILSLVRSNTNGEVGFLGEYRRLNVAMTRAKRQLCVVGDSSTVKKGSKYLSSWIKWLEDNADVRDAGEV